SDKRLNSGTVTYTDTGLAIGQQYTYRISVSKVTGGNTTTEFLDATVTMPTNGCLTATTTTTSASPSSTPVGASGNILLSAHVAGSSGPLMTGNIVFTVKDSL